ncbi:restriction endonuclease [Asanoa ferruginea]|uniref:Restriction endonuclease n=2 Tax=Asanoa ferruginea TaxID=53367 RepID=A0A3D9ZK96_9ACTN|nr:restriction endonuclease [Asanoa ferruginea]
MLEVFRYARGASQVELVIDGYPNHHFVTSRPDRVQPKIMLERGINATAMVTAADGPRRPLIAIRSSPWKAGHATNPWHDEFDLDHGHVRYFGDHKPGIAGMPGVTAGNGALLQAWEQHAASTEAERRLAPPLLLYRSITVEQGGRSIAKGHVEFCGVAVIERLEYVIQRDSSSGTSFPNIVLDLAILDLADKGDAVDLRWIDDRRDSALTAEEAMRHAPGSWRRWVAQGRGAIPQVRRRVVSSRVRSSDEQLPIVGSTEEAILEKLYRHFDGRKHAFELLAARIAGRILGGSGAVYHAGWLTRSGGDGGVDFVGRLDVGSTASNTPLIVLGQAKCVQPRSSIGADQVARVVARLRRGWLGVYVTTGVFSKQAQIEIIDDAYPLVLVNGRELVEQVVQLAAVGHGSDIDALLEQITSEYEGAVTHRRPEEILFA